MPCPRHQRTARWRRSFRESAVGLLFVAPALSVFIIFGPYTLIYAFLLSLHQWNGFSPDWTWVGAQNYRDLLGGDPLTAQLVRKALGNTAIVLVALPVCVIAISLPLAMLLNSIGPLRTALRTVYFLPYVTTGIAVFYAWRFLYEPDGVINASLRAIGLGTIAQPQGWLGNTTTALPAVLAVMVWATVPLGVLLYLTGLQSISPELIDAARIDGAGPVKQLRHVLWPMLAPVTALLVVIGLKESIHNFQYFLLLTNGGPIDSTDTLGLEVYRQSFGRENLAPNLGYGSALGWMLFVAALVLSLIVLRVLRDRTGTAS